MIKIICIKWGTKFSPEYVNKLFRGIQENTSKEFSFVCFTDNSVGIKYPEIKTPPIPFYTGDWYSKIGLYNKELYEPYEQVFFFDLDTVIMGNLDELFEYRGDFIILRDFYRPKGYQSAFMSWRPDAVDFMWKNYTRGNKVKNGDQGWPELQYPGADIWQDKYPRKIASYKVHVRDRKGPKGERMPMDDVRVMCFHGRPAVHEVAEYWNKYV